MAHPKHSFFPTPFFLEGTSKAGLFRRFLGSHSTCGPTNLTCRLVSWCSCQKETETLIASWPSATGKFRLPLTKHGKNCSVIFAWFGLPLPRPAGRNTKSDLAFELQCRFPDRCPGTIAASDTTFGYSYLPQTTLLYDPCCGSRFSCSTYVVKLNVRVGPAFL